MGGWLAEEICGWGGGRLQRAEECGNARRSVEECGRASRWRSEGSVERRVRRCGANVADCGGVRGSEEEEEFRRVKRSDEENCG